MAVRPIPGDIGIIEHYAFSDTFLIVEAVKVTAARIQISVLQPDGSWGAPLSRAVERFMFIPDGTSHEDLMAIRAELVEASRACRATIAEAKATASATAALLAARGKPLGDDE